MGYHKQRKIDLKPGSVPKHLIPYLYGSEISDATSKQINQQLNSGLI